MKFHMFREIRVKGLSGALSVAKLGVCKSFLGKVRIESEFACLWIVSDSVWG